MRPKIVLVITDQETNAQLSKLGVDFFELRVDLFQKSGVEHARDQFLYRRKLKVPLVLTVRDDKKEGAAKAMPKARKWELLQALLPMCDWVDIELSSPALSKTVALARRLKKKIIISSHDFKRMPKDLEKKLKQALKWKPDMVKVAALANTQHELMEMVEFTRHNHQHPLVTMCLGPWGGLSRLILPATGSPWIYTYLKKPTAPGQVDFKTLQKHLKIYYK